MSSLQIPKPEGLTCEAPRCRRPGSYVYGPECEAETGKLMYLCDEHGQAIKDWKFLHGNEPVECKEHGRIGKVKDSLILHAL